MRRKDTSGGIRRQILKVNLIIVVLAVVFGLGTTLAVTLSREYTSFDEKLLNSAVVLARTPVVAEILQTGKPSEQVSRFLDESIQSVSDIDVIVVADLEGNQLYYPDHAYIGTVYSGKDQARILAGEDALTSEDSGISGAERCAYSAVRDEDGTLLGFVMVGIYLRSLRHLIAGTVLQFALIGLVVIVLGGLLSDRLSNRIKTTLLGYEPDRLSALFEQRGEILEGLEEGLLAIDQDKNVMYINKAASDMLDIDKLAAIGKPLKEVYPRSTMARVMKSGRAEYNVSLESLKHVSILSDRSPITEDGRIIGAMAIFRNRTEVTQLAEDLTGVRHMVDAMRAYTHEFKNKLHVILGLLQLGENEQAESYIMDLTRVYKLSVDEITERIHDPSAAALLLGKSSHATELGIGFKLDPHSHLSRDELFLPSGAYVTILGNLIENAFESLNQVRSGAKAVTVSIREDGRGLLLCVDDTGPGIRAEDIGKIFEKGYSTKGEGHGTGLKLVRELTEDYHGTIRVESGPEVGTSFILNFKEPLM